LKRALTPEDLIIQKDSKIDSSTIKWFSNTFNIDVNDENYFNKHSIFKAANYKNKPSTTFFRALIKIITFGLSERLFDKNRNEQYMDKTTAFLAIREAIDEAFDAVGEGIEEVKFNIKLDGITKNIKLTQDNESVKIEVYQDGNKKPYSSMQILQCTLDKIKTSLINENKKGDEMECKITDENKNKIYDRVESNKLSKKDKESYINFSDEEKEFYNELEEYQKEIYFNFSDEEKEFYNELEEYQKEIYLNFSDEEKLSCSKLDKKHKTVYICIGENHRVLFIKKDLKFKDNITEMFNNCIEEFNGTECHEKAKDILNKYNLRVDQFFKDNEFL
jgi:hypothetical protein